MQEPILVVREFNITGEVGGRLTELRELIRQRYAGLTQGQQAVARFIITEPELTAFNTAKQVGEWTQTSETTVIRFANAIGYSGYSALQSEIRKSFIIKGVPSDPMQEYQDTTEQLAQQQDSYQAVMQKDVLYITGAMKDINLELLDTATKAIVTAEKIIVLGFRSSHGPAHWLAFTLNILRGNTELYRGTIDDAHAILSSLTRRCLVIAISFPRYTRETTEFVRAAKTRGAKILAITDNELSPIGLEGDVVIPIKTPSPSALRGMPTIFSVLNVLTFSVASTDKQRVQWRVAEYNQSYKTLLSGYYSETSPDSEQTDGET